MDEPYYEDILVQSDAEKIAIPEDRMEQILRQLDDLIETHEMVNRVAEILDRLSRSGQYAHIAYDPHEGVYVLIKPDGTRAAYAPERLDALFAPPTKRPQRPTLTRVR